VQEQNVTYNGYYRGHGLKYQAIIAPNGLLLDLAPAVTGRHHDGYAWTVSEVENKVRLVPPHPVSGLPYYVYGDPAYSTTDVLITGVWSPYLICLSDDVWVGGWMHLSSRGKRACTIWPFRASPSSYKHASVCVCVCVCVCRMYISSLQVQAPHPPPAVL
jgi:hypothetical protein